MPSDGQPHGDDGAQPQWRQNLADQLGEDPVRFLGLPDAERDALRPNSLLRARLRGIDRLETVRAWKAAERRLATERDREPRDTILRALEQVERRIFEHGERMDQREIDDVAERSREAFRLVDIDKGDPTFVDENGNEYDRSSAHISAESLVPDDPTPEAVADGGRADE